MRTLGRDLHARHKCRSVLAMKPSQFVIEAVMRALCPCMHLSQLQSIKLYMRGSHSQNGRHNLQAGLSRGCRHDDHSICIYARQTQLHNLLISELSHAKLV